jgi:hypothetical protein
MAMSNRLQISRIFFFNIIMIRHQCQTASDSHEFFFSGFYAPLSLLQKMRTFPKESQFRLDTVWPDTYIYIYTVYVYIRR